MITVIDLGLGNINSVSRALKYIGVSYKVADNPIGIVDSNKLIFPGVGNFYEAMKRMKDTGLDVILKEMVLEKKTPILGICLGMQLFATYGEEGDTHEGLGFIKGKVVYHRASSLNLRIPHIGWNDVNHNKIKLFQSVDNYSCFYFAHSYEFLVEENIKLGFTNYGLDFISVVQKDHIIGLQFHVEKSQKVGLKVLSNFCEGRF